MVIWSPSSSISRRRLTGPAACESVPGVHEVAAVLGAVGEVLDDRVGDRREVVGPDEVADRRTGAAGVDVRCRTAVDHVVDVDGPEIDREPGATGAVGHAGVHVLTGELDQ